MINVKVIRRPGCNAGSCPENSPKPTDCKDCCIFCEFVSKCDNACEQCRSYFDYIDADEINEIEISVKKVNSLNWVCDCTAWYKKEPERNAISYYSMLNGDRYMFVTKDGVKYVTGVYPGEAVSENGERVKLTSDVISSIDTLYEIITNDSFSTANKLLSSEEYVGTKYLSNFKSDGFVFGGNVNVENNNI